MVALISKKYKIISKSIIILVDLKKNIIQFILNKKLRKKN